MARHSGLQRQVLGFYRECMRSARRKPEEVRSSFEDHIRTEFLRHKNHPRIDVAGIEYLLRRGRKQLAVLSSPSCVSINSRILN
eukprot:gene7449-9790_t